MPKLDGLSLLHQSRTLHSQTDIIMMTAARSVDNIQSALRFGVIDYIVKPFSLKIPSKEGICQKVNQVLKVN
ncbi:response regulator [Zophobihabitans entericus]|uniref:Response regulator n=1 Tax=Zophobihabitans entericus TaxID=1635327 RepID=A0A6G9IAE2_9GAMM|nr:response regulator [Zophobihabitans entericus]